MSLYLLTARASLCSSPTSLTPSPQHLGSLDTLEHLTFRMANIDYASILQPTAQPFRCLCDLNITSSAQDSTSVISFLNALPGRGLVNFTLSYSSFNRTSPATPPVNIPRPEAQQLRPLFVILTSFDSLRTITLKQEKTSNLRPLEVPRYAVCDDIISTLSDNTHLTTFAVVNIPCTVYSSLCSKFLVGLVYEAVSLQYNLRPPDTRMYYEIYV
ncbi:hypothetical protein PHLGIDRAFT_445877 [Phlebiopsis gigantea 11061_1 CR5-6]|uniref:Uncharacterized protein n=1 Tax=Phlebiopsis gigantea (strain 11061_1 CR5-6) TaxID=745531 RepID=A0A0C3PKI3_PHLG1|nr:hypothetical protein PHLGIDRAFT_445877 [Phlebiopsis gigantea 11061_1 CR5-6]